MVLCFKAFIFAVLILIVVSCGQTGGEAPGSEIVDDNCDGVIVGGSCWYLGMAGASCTTTCAAHGGFNNATAVFAGHSGTDEDCALVLTALGRSGTANGQACDAGCYYNTSNSGRFRCQGGSGEAEIIVDGERACACNE
jgi:hypothetical protein